MNQPPLSTYEVLTRLVAMLLACIVLGGCAPSLMTVYREDPREPGRYIGSSEPRNAEGVAIFRHGQRVATGLPVALQPADVLETAADTVAVIRYPDGGQVVLDSSTRVRVGSLFVEFGRILARVRGLFAVETENVITGVEGTEYALEVKRGGAVAVIVLNGAVLCQSRTGSWAPMRVRGGEAFVYDIPNRMRPEIRRVSANEIEDIRRLWDEVDPGKVNPPPAGFCCDDGRVVSSPRDSCRGFFSWSEREAARACEEIPQQGYCCDRGRLIGNTRQECQRIQGAFFPDRSQAERACRVPPPENGYCCNRGRLIGNTRQECQSIQGAFFLDRSQAEYACRVPPPESGYCCARGKVFAATRERCESAKGDFHESEREAARACRRPPAIDRLRPPESRPGSLR